MRVYGSLRVHGRTIATTTHAFACVWGGGVVSFASLRVVSSRSLVSLASLLCLHVRGRVIAGLRVFYVFAIFGIFGIFVILGIFACLHVCMFAVVSWVACLRVGIFGIFAHACLQ